MKCIFIALKPLRGTKMCRKPGIGNNPPLFSIDPKGFFWCSHHRTVLTLPAFDNPVMLHWSQVGCVPTHGCILIVTEGVHREITSGIQYRDSFWLNAFPSLHGFKPTPTVVESGAFTAMVNALDH